MVWLMFFLPVVSAAVLPTQTESISKLQNSCEEKGDPLVCLASYGIDYLVGKTNASEGRLFKEGEKLLEDFFGSSDNEKDGDDDDRTWRINRRTIVPLVVGVTLKVLSIIPLVLSKLTLVGTIAILASKLSLLLSLVMALKKFFGGGGLISLNPLGYHGHGGHYDPHYGGYGGGHRRETYIIRGRDIEENAIEGINKWEAKNNDKRWKIRRGPQLPRPETEIEPITNDPYGDLEEVHEEEIEEVGDNEEENENVEEEVELHQNL